MLRKWSEPVVGEPEPGDVEWPPGSGQFLRPGPEAEALLLGRWPSQAVNSVWSEHAWSLCLRPAGEDGPLEIGADVARFGDDATCACVRKGPSAVDFQRRTKLDVVQTADLLRDLAIRWGDHYGIDPESVLIKVDDAGLGGGVTDTLRHYGWNAHPCLGAHKAINQRLYPNRRSESWFDAKGLAEEGGISLARLPADVRAELKRQLLGVKYALNRKAQREVEEKKVTKERLKKSPDEADAFLLCYGRPGRVAQAVYIGAGGAP
jgi:hypothetical protein